MREIEKEKTEGIKRDILSQVRQAYESNGVTQESVARGFKSLLRARKVESYWNQKKGEPAYTKPMPDNPIRLEAHKEVAAQLGMYPAPQGPTIDLPDIQFVLSGVDRDRLRGMDSFARLRDIGHNLLPGQTQEVSFDLEPAAGEVAGDQSVTTSRPESEAPGRAEVLDP